MTSARTEPVFLVRVVSKAPKTAAGGASSAERAAQIEQVKAKQLAQLYAGPARDGDTAAREKIAASEAALAAALSAEASARAARLAGAQPKSPPAEDPGEDVSKSVTSFVYQDSEKKTDLLKLTVDNHDLRFFDHAIFEKGTLLIVQWGYPNNLSPARQCYVKKVKGSTTLTIEADDRGALLNKQARSRTFPQAKRSDVARAIAAEQGFTGGTVHVEDTEVTFPVITQAAQTDAQFLKKLADLEGYEFFIDFDGFHWRPRSVAGKPVRKLVYYLPPLVGDIIVFDVENDITAKPGAVTVKGRNPLEKKDISVTADATNTARATLTPTQEVTAQPAPVTFFERVDGRTGQATTEHPSPAKNVGSLDPSAASTIQPSSATSAEQAKREATGQFVRTQQSSVHLTMTIVGDPQLCAKTVVEVAGLGKRLSGRYYVTDVEHKIEADYTCSLKARTDGTNKGAATKKDKGVANDKNADTSVDAAGAPPALATVELIDGRTGEGKTVYKDLRGKQ